MMGSWKKVENESGFLCYLNLDTNLKQWDHPKFSDVKQALDDCNYIAYAAYRLAFKIRVLQRCLYLEEIPLNIITVVFERHRLANTENSLVLETYDLEAVLSDVFYTANKVNHTNIDIDFATEIAINFLYNVFDCLREGKIQVLSTKMLLGLLCNCSLSELHKYLFTLCADHNNCITRVRLQGLLQKTHMVMKYLHEENYCFDLKSLNWAVEKCFRESPGLIGVTQTHFIAWLNTEVPFLSFLPLIYRLKAAETVISSVKCTTCKTRPLLGLRYHCNKCPKYRQCQRCFLTGRVSHSHKLSHALREYGAQGKSQVYLSKICLLFCSKRPGQCYSIVRPSRQFANENFKPYHSSDPMYDVEPLSPPEAQLQSIIRQLEAQNRDLQQLLVFGTRTDKEMVKYLEDYRIFMAQNIQKLKNLKQHINTPQGHDIQLSINNPITQSSLNMSPITVMTDLDLSDCDSKQNAKIAIPNSSVKVLHNDLDEALAKLQQILANNFSLEDSLSHLDNSNLKFAVTEVEGMLTSIIDNVESSRCNSALGVRSKSFNVQ
ncbi:dystrophin-like [Euwallacea similis]|uniref:dystrophin-like n=1 Tax=Euwallacea similis TaxID=1736056 RepID=UPI00344D5C05